MKKLKVWTMLLSAVGVAVAVAIGSTQAGATVGGSLEIQLEVAGDPVTFDVLIDEVVVATGGGGASTGEQAVSVGDHEVRLGPAGSNPVFYVTDFTCRDNDGAGAVVAFETVVSNASVTVPVAEGADIAGADGLVRRLEAGPSGKHGVATLRYMEDSIVPRLDRSHTT